MKEKTFCQLNDSLIDFTEQSFEHCYLNLSYRQSKCFKYGDVKLKKDF